MARVLTRPMFRKGGLSQTPRPTYRGGGVTTIRPRYRNGGMNGIMSGITPRRGYADGYSFQDFTESPIGGGLMYGIPGAVADTFYTPINLAGRLFGYNPGLSARKDIRAQKDKWFGTDREGRMTDEEVQKTNFFGIPFSAKSFDEAKQAKIAEENKKQQKVHGPMDYLQPGSQDPSQTGGGGAVQSDLESLQDYMKMFAAASAADPDETRKANWLEVAKIGANILAQPGGDLTGAIGKATSRSLEGISKRIATDKAAKQQAKLLGLKVGAEAMGGGEFGRKINTLARLTGKSKESIAKKFLAGDYDFDKEYLAAAEASGVEVGEARKIYLKNIKIMSDKHPEIAARLNKPFPKKNAVEGEYYVLPGGQFTRWVDGEKLKPTDPGFYDKEI